MTQNFYSRSIQDILKAIQKYYNILIVFHPSEPSQKRIYVTQSFSPVQNMIYFHTLIGKDITHLIDTNVLTQYVGNQLSQDNEFLQRQTLQTQIETVSNKQIQLSPDFAWEWHLQS